MHAECNVMKERRMKIKIKRKKIKRPEKKRRTDDTWTSFGLNYEPSVIKVPTRQL